MTVRTAIVYQVAGDLLTLPAAICVLLAAARYGAVLRAETPPAE